MKLIKGIYVIKGLKNFFFEINEWIFEINNLNKFYAH